MIVTGWLFAGVSFQAQYRESCSGWRRHVDVLSVCIFYIYLYKTPRYLNSFTGGSSSSLTWSGNSTLSWLRTSSSWKNEIDTSGGNEISPKGGWVRILVIWEGLKEEPLLYTSKGGSYGLLGMSYWDNTLVFRASKASNVLLCETEV